ncbi:MAG: recombinase family protein [Rhodospirillales bacterium]|nr:recombinase family protein [Rhodospirillales bacterium]
MPAKGRGASASPAGRSDGVRRCAIYTRKSSEEGLEQSFNSLDAQREACEAYIASQRHEGWRVLPTAYDDGGISGGTMDRPALLQLLRDIRARKVDLVVVYKVDRLTRSLADFAKIVEVFDANGVSFVSVTQQFNTASSMGRLTLNMLLSFAQFEREVTGERIRDKIAASKRKGMWMGGVPPLGYDIQDRTLVINEEEAQTVRYIFETYVTLGAVRPLQELLDAERITTKRHISAKGNSYGGRPISRGYLYRILQNRLYRGEIVHNGQTYPGQHEPIIDADLWDRVQAQLEQNRVEQRAQQTTIQTSMLAGLVTDQAGDKLVPTYSNKNGKRYRYYVSQSLITGTRGNAPHAIRVPAADLERLVSHRLCRWLTSPGELIDALASNVPATKHPATIAAAAKLATTWNVTPTVSRCDFLKAIVDRITITDTSITIAIRPLALAQHLLGRNGNTISAVTNADLDIQDPIVLTIYAQLCRTGLAMKLVAEGPDATPDPDPTLIRLLARAHAMRNELEAGNHDSIEACANAMGVTSSYVGRIVRLAYLAPDITTAILDGRQPANLTAARLAQTSDLPLAWSDQRRVLGFA